MASIRVSIQEVDSMKEVTVDSMVEAMVMSIVEVMATVDSMAEAMVVSIVEAMTTVVLMEDTTVDLIVGVTEEAECVTGSKSKVPINFMHRNLELSH